MLSLAHQAAAAPLDTPVQQRIRAATFEVVQAKPSEQSVTYERALPLELIPYQERIDKYRSVGTAFAIGANRYVTAAHVLVLGMGSQFGPPALRDGAGNVYAIDKVVKYSEREDFVEFSMREEPKGVQTLELGDAPSLNDAVFAVGNALGEGIVIRDGVHTSDTPEEQEGQWKWLRFSAAASPGNSGGPLVNQAGQVIGVVLRKSEAENLNYALSIAQVASAKEGEGRFDSRQPIRLANMDDSSETFEVHERIALPKPLPEFYTTLHDLILRNAEKGEQLLLSHNKDKLFPHGDGAAQLLMANEASPMPTLLRRAQDGQWGLATEQSQRAELGNNGALDLAGGAFRLRVPNDVKLAALYADSKLYMDLILKGSPLQRTVGTDTVRVLSLGRAFEHWTYTDDYGRVWRIDVWSVPYDDLMLISFALPTPEGYVGFLSSTLTGFRDVAIEGEKLLSDFIYVTMEGTLAQWQDYEAQKDAQPKAFSSITLDIEPEHRVRFRSQRWELEVTPGLLTLADDTRLALNFSFFRDRDRVVWDVSSLDIGATKQKNEWVQAVRISRPADSLPQRYQDLWGKLQGAEYPYNASAIRADGSTRIFGTVQPVQGAGERAQFCYVLGLVGEGEQSQDVMTQRLDQLRASFKLLEH